MLYSVDNLLLVIYSSTLVFNIPVLSLSSLKNSIYNFSSSYSVVLSPDIKLSTIF